MCEFPPLTLGSLHLQHRVWLMTGMREEKRKLQHLHNAKCCTERFTQSCQSTSSFSLLCHISTLVCHPPTQPYIQTYACCRRMNHVGLTYPHTHTQIQTHTHTGMDTHLFKACIASHPHPAEELKQLLSSWQSGDSFDFLPCFSNFHSTHQRDLIKRSRRKFTYVPRDKTRNSVNFAASIFFKHQL